MAITKDEIAAAYPLPAYNYKVEIDGATVGFSEVSGLNIEYETISYHESPGDGQTGPQAMHMPGKGTPVSVSLTKGYVTGNSITHFYEWISSIQLNRVDKKDINVSLCDEEGSPVVVWKVLGAFPVNLTAPTFSAESSEIAIENLELMADDLQMEEL